MAFTYSDLMSLNRDKVRFYLRDVTEDSGPLPGGTNFSDNEIAALLSIEDTWQQTVAAGFEALASAWSNYADLSVGPRRESLSQIAKRYEAVAKRWREQYGFTQRVGVAAAGIIKVDGYSDDVTSDNMDTSSEYGTDFEYVRPVR
jgi:hypothetical protein